MIKTKLTNIPSHLSVAREVSRDRNRNLLSTIFKMTVAKIYFSIPIKDYALNDLERIPLKFWKNFINKRSLTDIQKKLNPSSLRKLIDDKIDFYYRCLNNDLPTPKVWAIICNNRNTIGQIPQGTHVICGKKKLYNFLYNKEAPKDLIIKRANGAYSEGLISLKVKSDGLFDNFNRPYKDFEIYNHCLVENPNKAFIVQERLKPHPGLRPLMPGIALGCIRVVTYFSDSGATVLFVFIKIPVGDNVTDAFQHGATGNLLAYLDLATGKLGKAWGKRGRQDIHCLTEFTAHPTTGVMFQGFQIPQWDDVLRLAKRGAEAFPELRLIGWDMALCENGIFLMEGNNLWDPDGPQVTLRKGIKKEMTTLV